MPSLTAYKASLDYSYAPGLFPTIECLKHREKQVRRVLVSEKTRDTEAETTLLALCGERNIRVEYADRVLRQISGKENCHAAAVFAKYEDTLAQDRPHIVLHHPSDCGNAGTILRTALGFGYTEVALIRPCVDLFDPRVVRSSMGSLFSLHVHVYDSFEAYREAAPGHLLYPFMLDASVPLASVTALEKTSPFALVFGNEGTGLPAEFAQLGQAVRIESNSRVDSLNLSIAAGIGMYHFAGLTGIR